MTSESSSSPLVSVLMGIYNCASTLPRALDSLIAQSYTHFECILCDDGSTDNTFSVATHYVQKDSRFLLLKNDSNQGLSATLNTCFAKSQGFFLARMDGDDQCIPDRFERQVHFLQRHCEYDMCASSLFLFDENGIWGKRPYPEFPTKKSFLFGTPFAHPSVMFSRKVLMNTSYKTNTWIGRSEDYYLFMQLYAKGFKGYNLQDPVLNYCESFATFKKRKFKYVLTEFFVRLKGFAQLHILFPLGIFYAFKPLIIALIPKHIQIRIRKRIYDTNSTMMNNIIR